MEHKIASKILAIFVLSIMLFGALCSLCFGVKNYAFADGEPLSIALVSPSYAEALSGASLYGFTPMDFENDARMAGQSVKPNTETNGTFSLALSTENSQALDASQNYELGMWVYFPSANLFNLTITLAGTGEKNMNITITSEELAVFLRKPATKLFSQDTENDGFGWAYLEIPFNAFPNKTNAIDGDNFVAFSSIGFTYATSSENASGALLFYNICIKNSTLAGATIKDENKQPYRLFKVEPNIDFGAIFLGDTLSLPQKTTMVKYAYVGEINVLEDTTNYTISAKVSNSSEIKPWEFNGNFTFDTEGATHVDFVATAKADNSIVLFDITQFQVYEFVGLFINQNIKTFYVGQRVAIYAGVNAKLTSFDNLHFEIEGESAKIVSTNIAEKYVVIEIVKAGSFKLKATAAGERKYDASLALSASKTFEAKELGDNKTGVRIALFVALGLLAAAGVGFGIKAIVDANKYKVR